MWITKLIMYYKTEETIICIPYTLPFCLTFAVACLDIYMLTVLQLVNWSHKRDKEKTRGSERKSNAVWVRVQTQLH